MLFISIYFSWAALIKKYQENLQAERRANPDEGVVQKTVEKAQGLVDKITGND